MNRSAYNEFLILVNRCPLRSLRFLELLETQLCILTFRLIRQHRVVEGLFGSTNSVNTQIFNTANKNEYQ